MKSFNYILTVNNPDVTLVEFVDYAKAKGATTIVA